MISTVSASPQPAAAPRPMRAFGDPVARQRRGLAVPQPPRMLPPLQMRERPCGGRLQR
jgi:hypothetical protein